MKLYPHRQWVGAVYAEDLALMREMLIEDPSLANSMHCEFDDPFRYDRYPVPSLLFAVNGPPPQQLAWSEVERPISFEMVKLLIEFGADPNIDSGHGLPICYVRNEPVARYLIDHGADINRWTDGGGAPVFFSVWNADPDRLELQLKLGADPHVCDPRTGESALHALCLQIPKTAKHEAALLDVAKILFSAGIDPNGRTKTNCVSDALECGLRLSHETPLHLAAAFNVRAIVQMLLDHGCDRSLANADGDTPQDLALRRGRESEIMDILT